jgi:hypothetical protein
MPKQSLLILSAAVLALGATAATASAKPTHACHTWRHAAVQHHRHYARQDYGAGYWRESHMGMRPHWGEGERAEFGRAEWRSSHGEERSWSHVEGDTMAYEGAYEGERPWATDRYGYLTWPGKTHFGHAPMAREPEAGPPLPPEEGPPLGPQSENSYEIYRF